MNSYELEIGDFSMPQQPFAVVSFLENGQTCPYTRKGMIDACTAEQASNWISSHNQTGQMAYTADGLYGPKTMLGDRGIRVTSCRAIPRQEYNSREHDTLHFDDGAKLRRFQAQFTALLQQGEALVRPDAIGTVPDILLHYRRFLTANNVAAQVINQAHPVVWLPHMMITSCRAAWENPLPMICAESLLPLSPMLWLYCELSTNLELASQLVDEGQPLYTAFGHIPWPNEYLADFTRPLVARLIDWTDDGISVTEVFAFYNDSVQHFDIGFNYQHGNSSQNTWVIPWGAERKNMFEGEATLEDIRELAEHYFLSLLRFIQSPYITWEPAQYARHALRRFERQTKQVCESMHVIKLRRVVNLAKKLSTGHRAVDWQHQWWVSSHWRNQWCPSKKEHRPTWIDSYIKGPEDKPLRDAVRIVMR